MRTITTEVTMRRFNDVLELLKPMRLDSAIVVLAVVVFGAFLAPTDSRAQAVPPRVQSLMINKPLVPPPTPPLHKAIGQVKQQVQKQTQTLDQKIEAFLGVKPPPPLYKDSIFRPPPPEQPKLSRDEEIRYLERRVRKLQRDLTDLTRRLDDLKGQPRK